MRIVPEEPGVLAIVPFPIYKTFLNTHADTHPHTYTRLRDCSGNCYLLTLSNTVPMLQDQDHAKNAEEEGKRLEKDSEDERPVRPEKMNTLMGI